MKTILALRKSLQVVIHSGSGQPVAVRVHIPQLVGWFTSVLIALLILGGLSLLFFRELEINRKLETRLLTFETQEKLWQTSWNGAETSNDAPTPGVVAPGVPAPVVDRATTATKTSDPAPASTASTAKIGELATTCNGDECQVRLAMATTGAGVANGFLLIVMEAEVPRIGANTAPEAQMRKRYFFYPEQEPKEELEPNDVSKLQRRSFSFSRALKTSATFKVGKLLRPLSVNAYLFDNKNALLQHERRAITDEP